MMQHCPPGRYCVCFSFPANAMPFRLTGLAMLFTLMLLIQAQPVTAETSPMPTKTPFDPLPTKTAFPVVPPTKTPVRVELPGMTVSPTERLSSRPRRSAPHVRVDRAATPTASLSSTPVPTHRPASTATPLPSATVIITEPPTPVQTQTCPPQSSTSPTFIVISSPNSSAPVSWPREPAWPDRAGVALSTPHLGAHRSSNT